jgi:hypothetical protein
MTRYKKSMFDATMEVLKPSMGAGAYIKDFRKSDAPQFKGKSEKERDKMAIAAYLDAKDEVNEGAKNSVISMTKFKNPKIVKQVSDIIKKVGTDKIKVKKIPGGMEIAGSNVHLTQVIDRFFDQTIKTSKGDFSTPALIRMKEDYDYETFVIMGEEVEQLDEKIAGLEKKSDQTGVPYGILKKSYDRGVAAWRTGHRPGTTPQQWAFARVNSMLTGGKADPDLQAKIKAGGYKKKKKAKKEETNLDEDAKMAKQSDADLKSMMKKMRDAEKKDPKMPSTQFMIKRISKEMKKRGLKEETIKEFKNMIVTINDPRKRKKAIDDLVKKNFGIKKDIMNPKKFKVYGNDTDLNKYAKDLKNFYGATIKAEEFQIKEDGHMDVPSSIRMCKTIIEDANEIQQILSSKGDENIDTWWTNKLAVAASSLNKLRDYIKNPMEEGRKSKYAQDDEDEEGANKHIVMQLRKTVDLKGNFKTEFEDGKKQKIPLEIARKLSHKYNMLKKPIEKEIFQKRISKSYRDLLKVAKEK